jgi:hypothetical protein
MKKFLQTTLIALALLLPAPVFAVVATVFTSLNSTGWTDLGPGPAFISSTGPGYFLIGDSNPGSTVTIGYNIPVNGVALNTPSHIWGRIPPGSIASAIVAPVTSANSGGGAGSIKVGAATGPPFIVPSSGQFGANGAVTFTTALSPIQTSGYFYFPVNAINGSNGAGFYWGTCTTGTACTIYQNIYNVAVGGSPPYVSSPTPWVSSAQAAYTQTTGAVLQGLTYVLPGNTLGVNDGMRCDVNVSTPPNADTKTISCNFGGFNTGSTSIGGTAASFSGYAGFRNTGVLNHQSLLTLQNFTTGTGNGVTAYGSVDTTQTQSYRITFQLGTATDFMILNTGYLTLVTSP